MPRDDLNRKKEWMPSLSLLPSLRAFISCPARRVAALEAKQKPCTPQRQGLTEQDQLIAERLTRLRQEKKPSE